MPRIHGSFAYILELLFPHIESSSRTSWRSFIFPASRGLQTSPYRDVSRQSKSRKLATKRVFFGVSPSSDATSFPYPKLALLLPFLLPFHPQTFQRLIHFLHSTYKHLGECPNISCGLCLFLPLSSRASSLPEEFVQTSVVTDKDLLLQFWHKKISHDLWLLCSGMLHLKSIRCMFG